jgi:streptogramin lyase
VSRTALLAAILFAATAVPAAGPPPAKLDLHVVPTPVKSYRLLAMDRDDDGFVWAGSVHQSVHRYDPRTGEVKTVPLPAKATASACICLGDKVYVLGQAYPKLIVYDRKDGTFAEKAYPSDKPDVWYGTKAPAGRSLYLFDRGGSGVVKWDTATDTGKAVPWPYKTPFPGSGQFEADGALWCRVWDVAGGKYVPLGLARLDAAKDEFTGFYPFPKDDADLKPFTDPKATAFLPHTLKGKLVPFDVKQKRWCRAIDVPGYGKRFGFLGGPTAHAGRLYFSASTYDGTDVGCDGKPYHFVNGVLEFDPATGKFEFLELEAKDAYHQVAYTLSAGGEFFATGTNIRQPNGALDRDRAGEVVFWQTLRPARN